MASIPSCECADERFPSILTAFSAAIFALGTTWDAQDVSGRGGSVGVRQADVGKGVVRVDRCRLLQELNSFLDFRQGDLLDVVPTLEVELIRLAARGVRLATICSSRPTVAFAIVSRCRVPSRSALRRGPSWCCRSARPRGDRRHRFASAMESISLSPRRSSRPFTTASTDSADATSCGSASCPCSGTPCCAL